MRTKGVVLTKVTVPTKGPVRHIPPGSLYTSLGASAGTGQPGACDIGTGPLARVALLVALRPLVAGGTMVPVAIDIESSGTLV